MPGSKPQKVVIEFDDGSKREVSFERLPSPLQFELLRQPFASQPHMSATAHLGLGPRIDPCLEQLDLLFTQGWAGRRRHRARRTAGGAVGGDIDVSQLVDDVAVGGFTPDCSIASIALSPSSLTTISGQ